MPLEARLLCGLAVALGLVYSATPLAIRLADRLQFYDRPTGYKGHARPTPYLGGAAVMAGFAFAFLGFSSADWDRTVPLLGGVAVLWFVGTLDDRRNVSPQVRIAVEAGLAFVLWRAGLGWELGAGPAVDLALTVAWILAVVNAFNLFDNMDGAASTMALVVSAGVLAMGVLAEDAWLAVAAAALCGACLGFLPHNLASPARIFLGDGGSMPIGFAVGALVMIGAADGLPAGQALVVSVLLVGVPALDTSLVLVSRRRRGVSFLTGGQDHLTHRTQRRLRTARAVAIALGAVQALVSALALFAINGGATAVVVVVVLYLVFAAMAIALLEAGERERVTTPVAAGTAVAGMPPPRVRRALPSAGLAVLFAFGVAAGTSAFSAGFYDSAEWVPIGLGLLVVAAAGAIARPPSLTRPALVALGGLTGLAAWALLSSAWAPSITQAVTEGNRLFVLAVILATGLVLVSTTLDATWLVAGLAVGVAAVGAWVIASMLGGAPATLFIAGRLEQPIGYINAQGSLFVMGFWLWFALAERRHAALAGAGAGMATLMSCLVLLSQSRGAVLALLVSVAVVLLLAPGSRLRRVIALLVCAGGVAAAGGALLDVYETGRGTVAPSVGHGAAAAALLATFGVGLAWGLAVLGHARAVRDGAAPAARLRRAAVVALSIGALVVAAGALITAGRIENAVSTQWTAFSSGQTGDDAGAGSPAGSRLASGSGNRYQYWEIAWDAFADRPLMGVGAGNYDRPYFQARQTREDIRQPHSLVMQSLAELGLVGGLLVAGVFGAVGLALWRLRNATPASGSERALGVAAAGAVSAWMVHTSVDWLHLLPGLSAIALLLGGVLLRDRRPPRAATGPAAPGRLALRPAALAGATVAGLALVLGAASLSRQGLADLFRDRANDALAERPADTIREANRSLRLDAENPRTYYVKAAALARFNQGDAARATLLRAAAKEPDDFVTWSLLGDLAARRGRLDEAGRNYARAAALNPGDPTLRHFAEDPSRALNRVDP